jgi:hypothetical protein
VVSVSVRPRAGIKGSTVWRHREDFTPVANPELARWMRALRSSSAAQRHVPAPRKGTRRERERQALRDQMREQ